MGLKLCVIILLVFSIQCKKRQAPKPKMKAVGIQEAQPAPSTKPIIDSTNGSQDASNIVIEQTRTKIQIDSRISDPLDTPESIDIQASKALDRIRGSDDSSDFVIVTDRGSDDSVVSNDSENLERKLPESVQQSVKMELAVIDQEFLESGTLSLEKFEESFSSRFMAADASEHVEFRKAFKDKFDHNYIPVILILESLPESPYYFILVEIESDQTVKVIRDSISQLALGIVDFERLNNETISSVQWNLKIKLNSDDPEIDMSGSSPILSTTDLQSETQEIDSSDQD